MTTAPAAPAAAQGTPAAPAPGAAPAAPAAPAAFEAPWSKAEGMYTIGEGENAKPWYEGIAEEPIKEYIKTKGYANPYEAARAAWNSNQMNKLEPAVQAYLEGKATPEQEAAILNKLGRPESPDKYEFKHPDGVTVDQDLESLGRNIFHKLGVPQTKAQEAMDMWNKAVADKVTKNTEAARVANEKALEELGKTWGADLDKNKAAGNRVLQSLNLKPEVVASIEENMGSAAFVEMMVAIGRRSDEGAFKGGNDNAAGDPNNVANMTPEAAAARIKVLQGDSDFQAKYGTANHPEHKQALELMASLFAKAGKLAA